MNSSFMLCSFGISTEASVLAVLSFKLVVTHARVPWGLRPEALLSQYIQCAHVWQAKCIKITKTVTPG